MPSQCTKPTAARTRRIAGAIEAQQTAAKCIGEVNQGMAIFAITRGQFSMIDIISHLIDQVGRCRVSVWTWCIADYEVESFEKLLNEKRITAATLIIDRSAEHRNAELIERWRCRFGVASVRVCANHAKIATVSTRDTKLLARGSMNLNFNPRFEQFDLSEGGDAFDMVHRMEEELPILHRNCSKMEAKQASKVSNSWLADQLKLFGGFKPWHK